MRGSKGFVLLLDEVKRLEDILKSLLKDLGRRFKSLCLG